MADDKEISAAFPFESKFVEVEGSKIHYVEEGTGGLTSDTMAVILPGSD